MAEIHSGEGTVLQRHLYILGQIYSFIGWLGLIGGAALILLQFQPQPGGEQATGVEFKQALSSFFLICWSIILLNFSKDINGQRRWSTGIGGFLIAGLNLLSIPIGTAIGSYTLWILVRHRGQFQR